MTAAPEVDVLVIGSGPIGATYARAVLELAPDATVIMVERGGALSAAPGTNLKNFLAGGVRHGELGVQTIPVVPAESLARAGTTLFDPRGPRPGHMPAAAVSTNVGGMGAHWSCATPAPGGPERVNFIDEHEWDDLLATAAGFLRSSTQAFGSSGRGAAIIETLGACFGGITDRPVQVMPHACCRTGDGRLDWTGTDTVLGPILGGPARFELRSNTLCRRLVLGDDRVVGADVVDVRTGMAERISARCTVVACDSLRTPQLLWASGIRPTALGHYLNEHPMVGATVVLDDDTMARAATLAADLSGDPAAAVWVPYAAGSHPFSGQINTSPGSPAGFAVEGIEEVPPERVISLTWFCPKPPRFADRVEFVDQLDADGMPLPDIHYELTDEDRRTVARAVDLATTAGKALGRFVAGEEPSLHADGQSLHYMGTTRMGEVDDGTSVCDGYSRVWGVRSLYVGGNGVIPTATACNPTLTSAALAVRAARAVAAELNL